MVFSPNGPLVIKATGDGTGGLTFGLPAMNCQRPAGVSTLADMIVSMPGRVMRSFRFVMARLLPLPASLT